MVIQEAASGCPSQPGEATPEPCLAPRSDARTAVPNRADAELLWTPGWEWLGAVVVLHALATVPWVAHLGAWPLLPAGLSLLYHGWVFTRREVWRFALVEERVVIFEPKRQGAPLRSARLRGPPWMTARWVVLRTGRRVLVLRAGRFDPALFARLRRALLAAPDWPAR